MNKPPDDLVVHTRFDLMAKYLYADALEKGYKTDYYLELYKQNLEVWNGFKEKLNPEKNTFEKFLTEFHDELASIKKHGYLPGAEPVPVMIKGCKTQVLHYN